MHRLTLCAMVGQPVRKADVLNDADVFQSRSRADAGRQLRALAWPWRRLLTAAQDRDWTLGPAVRTHVVICGFPRAGTSLAQLMAQSCVDDLTWFAHELCALDAAQCALRRHSILLTKRPRDVFLIPEISAFHRRRGIGTTFILMMRDPRAVLTSKHPAKPGRYFVPVELWRAIYQHWRWAITRDDTIELRYEDLVRNPAAVQAQLSEAIDWTVQHPFERFHEVARGISTDGALTGLRPPDPENINRWRDPAHHDRIRSLLHDAMPELPDVLIELGYERDDSWAAAYR